jgi:hypothetical protein
LVRTRASLFRLRLGHTCTRELTEAFVTDPVSQVWGADDDGGGLAFKQRDIDKVVEVAHHRGNAAQLFPLTAASGRPIRNLCISVRRALASPALARTRCASAGADVMRLEFLGPLCRKRSVFSIRAL